MPKSDNTKYNIVLHGFKCDFSQQKKSDIIDIYKSYILYLSNVQNKRWKQYSFFITVTLGFVSLGERFLDDATIFFVSILLVFVNIFWLILTFNNNKELRTKFDILRLIEESIGIRIFYYELKLYALNKRISNIIMETYLAVIFLLFSILYCAYKFTTLYNIITITINK